MSIVNTMIVLVFIDGLLNHAGSDINLQQLIENIHKDLRIPNLRNSLCKIMRDYNIQVRVGIDFVERTKR